MKKEFDQKMLAECLPYLTGAADAHNIDPKENKDFVQYLQCVGIAGLDSKGDYVVYNSSNFLKVKNDRKEDKDTFVGLDFEEKVAVSDSFDVKVVKNQGETYALITTTNDRPIGAVKFVQDTRNQWLDIPNDTRPWDMAVIVKNYPELGSGSPYFDFWKKVANKDGSKSIRSTAGNLKPYMLNTVIDMINAKFFGFQTKSVVQRHTFNASEKRLFINNGGNDVVMNDCRLEIVKSSGSMDGEIYVDGNSVGTVTMVKKGLTEAILRFDLDDSKITEDLGRTQIYDGIQKMFIIEHPKTKKLGKGKGGFKNNAMSEALDKVHA